MKTFRGFIRENGSVGIRNDVLVLSATRSVRILTESIAKAVSNTKTFTAADEDGKSAADRQIISRVFIGLAANPNIASVIIVCNKEEGGYPELNPLYLKKAIERAGQKVILLSVERAGGFYSALGEGIRIARRLVVEASRLSRREVSIDKLCIGVKCGLSDATSGISGNPVLGRVVNELIDCTGTAIFSETTEVIGAENFLAQRFTDERQKLKFLEAVRNTEDQAKRIGEDIRTINPIPANIEAGISSLEEKSLGALAKTGDRPIRGVLAYGEKPSGNGLYFMDSWMSSTSLFLGYAAAGAQLAIFQMGGSALPSEPPMPSLATGIAAPIYYMTGNPRTYKKAADEIDFNAGEIIDKTKTLDGCAKELVSDIIDTASGKITKAESWRYNDASEIYLAGPNL